MIHLDSSFAIDLLRERRKGARGPATQWLTQRPDEELGMCVHVQCELLVGARLAGSPEREEAAVRALLREVALVGADHELAEAYAELTSWLLRRGERISTMDALIAAGALAEGAPLLTRNVREFERVPGLRVETY